MRGVGLPKTATMDGEKHIRILLRMLEYRKHIGFVIPSLGRTTFVIRPCLTAMRQEAGSSDTIVATANTYFNGPSDSNN
jgi:hypothetical protein